MTIFMSVTMDPRRTFATSVLSAMMIPLLTVLNIGTAGLIGVARQAPSGNQSNIVVVDDQRRVIQQVSFQILVADFAAAAAEPGVAN